MYLHMYILYLHVNVSGNLKSKQTYNCIKCDLKSHTHIIRVLALPKWAPAYVTLTEILMAGGLFDEQLYLSVNIDHLLVWKIIALREGILEHGVLMRQDYHNIICVRLVQHTCIHTHVHMHTCIHTHTHTHWVMERKDKGQLDRKGSRRWRMYSTCKFLFHPIGDG